MASRGVPALSLTSRFLPPRPAKVTIYTTNFFLSSENLGIWEVTKHSSGTSSKKNGNGKWNGK